MEDRRHQVYSGRLWEAGWGRGMAKRTSSKSVSATRDTAGAEAQGLLEQYLSQLNDVRTTGAGVAETSYYPALANLFNAVGKTLKPGVRCVMNLKQQGAGMPDGGLFTADQFERKADTRPGIGQLPARGAIEAKPPGKDVRAIAASQQVKDYLSRYGIVIVSNLRDFLIVERGTNDQPVERESISLASNEKEFWEQKAAHPRAAGRQHGDQFIEFIRRACLHAAPLTKPKDVAWFLASYARDALFRVERRKELPALQTVREALEEALGMKFTDERGEHFFRSTLVQTLFYGVFSAWVLWHRENPGPKDKFDWQKAVWSLHVPFIRTLYEEVAKPSRLGPLKLVEVLEWAAGVLNRVDRGEFFKRFQEEGAVQYFYEPFLEAYDPELRKALGVWYTPPEIVKYQVARVDTVLREELDLPDGLADPNVIVLDPCCGTGAYLVEVLKRIEHNIRDKFDDALVGNDVKNAAMTRVFGFEILPAPFVIAHLQLGLLLQETGLPLSVEKSERVGVYLTNALTGWEPPIGIKATLPLPYPELAEERDAAERIKREKKILVVLGNPPYNAFAGVSPQEEQGLVEPYKEKLNTPTRAGGWGIKKFNLDDLYVRFFRLAERRIAEMTGKGVISFISNFSYLSGPSFVVMRQRFLGEFDKLWFDCMNGDSRETGKLTPEGKPDPSVFSTEYNREGIRVGTAVCVIVRKPVRQKKPIVRFRHFWGACKRAELLDSLNNKRFDFAYDRAEPRPENQLSCRPEDVADHYTEWPKLTDICAVAPFNGPVERRGCSLISFDRRPLEIRLRAYFDRDISDAEVAEHHASLLMTGNRIVGPQARKKLQKEHAFDKDCVVRYPFKPFDVRWAYLANIRPLFSEPSPHLLSQRFLGNGFFISRDTADKTPEGPPFFFSRLVCDYDSVSGHARHFPILLRNGSRLEKEAEATLFSALGEQPGIDVPVANLSASARHFLRSVKIKDPDADAKTAGQIWMHALAIGFSPAYLTENADGIRRDWPRIPMPIDRKLLQASAALGEQIAALLDSETDVPGVTVGKLQPCFRTLCVPSRIGGRELNPNAGDFGVTVGWGHVGKGGVTMPGKGKITDRAYDDDEAKAIEAEAAVRKLPSKEVMRLLGAKTCDVYLNGTAYWRNIPKNVWEYRIGGYQVIKKWLSYREEELLGRALTPEEAREVTNMARRIAGIILLQPKLDDNYHTVKASAFDWSAVSDG